MLMFKFYYYSLVFYVIEKDLYYVLFELLFFIVQILGVREILQRV